MKLVFETKRLTFVPIVLFYDIARGLELFHLAISLDFKFKNFFFILIFLNLGIELTVFKKED